MLKWMARSFLKWGLLLGTLVLVPSVSYTQKPIVIPLVPAANWQLEQVQTLKLGAVEKYGGDPAIAKEYGVKSIELRTYHLRKAKVQVLVEKASDPTAAYGLLTFYRDTSMTAVKGVKLAYGNANGTLMARGRNFLRFLRPPNTPLSDNDYDALLVFVGGTRPSGDVMAGLPAPMPTKDMVPGSEKYLLGLNAAQKVLPSFRTDLLGFDQGAEVQLAQYQSKEGRSTLMVVSYPTPQIARLRFGAMSKLLDINKEDNPASIYGRRSGSYLFLVLNSGTEKAAMGLMNQLKVARTVSWDQQPPTKESFTLQVVQMILAILVLTFFVALAGVVAGVLFFVSKRLAAKFFPDWEWGHSDEDQLITLKLR
jgi:hypothetical protein